MLVDIIAGTAKKTKHYSLCTIYNAIIDRDLNRCSQEVEIISKNIFDALKSITENKILVFAVDCVDCLKMVCQQNISDDGVYQQEIGKTISKYRDKKDHSLLDLAITIRNIKITEALIEAEFDANCKSLHGSTSLHLASRHRATFSIVELYTSQRS